MTKKQELLTELEELIKMKQEAAGKYQLRKKEIVDFDIRSAYDILQLSSEGDETRLRTLMKKR